MNQQRSVTTWDGNSLGTRDARYSPKPACSPPALGTRQRGRKLPSRQPEAATLRPGGRVKKSRKLSLFPPLPLGRRGSALARGGETKQDQPNTNITCQTSSQCP